MPIIGNPIYQSAFVVDQFSGNGSTTAFTMSVAPAGVTNVLVAVSGVLQDPSTYGVVGNTITFSAAPPSGTGNISCRYLGVPASGVTTTAYRTVTEFTATASQTTFTPPSYNVGFINVYLNGVLLGSADYTATNGTTVVLAIGASAGNLLTVESFQISSVANAISNSAGSVSNSNLATDSVTTAKIVDANVTTAKIADANVTAAKLASGAALTNLGTAQLADANMAPGSILQVVQTTKTDTYTTTSTGSFQGITGMSVTITPISTSSRIVIMVSLGIAMTWNAGRDRTSAFRVNRNGSATLQGDAAGSRVGSLFRTGSNNSDSNHGWGASFQFVDSPASTSALTYQLFVEPEDGATFYLNRSTNDENTSDAYGARTASAILVMEIAG